MRIRLSGLIVTLLMIGGSAQAATLTFDSIPESSLAGHTALFTEAGFDIDLISTFADDGLPNGTELEPLCCFSSGSATFTRTGGGTFVFTSVDIEQEYFGATPASFLRLEGFLGAVSQGVDIFTTTGFLVYSTRTASVLSGVTIDRLVVTGQRDFDAGIAYDNLVLDESVTAVPEPASIMLVGGGLLIAARRLRRRQG